MSKTAPKARITTEPARPTKADKILKLLQRNTGASVAELAKATGWQTHSVQGFMSGTLKKKRGLEIRSPKEDGKDRRYAIERTAR